MLWQSAASHALVVSFEPAFAGSVSPLVNAEDLSLIDSLLLGVPCPVDEMELATIDESVGSLLEFGRRVPVVICTIVASLSKETTEHGSFTTKLDVAAMDEITSSSSSSCFRWFCCCCCEAPIRILAVGNDETEYKHNLPSFVADTSHCP